MKIRNGFVSNSSSSSFIIGIANLGKKERGNFVFEPACEENNWVEGYLPYYINVSELKDGRYNLKIKSFNDSFVEVEAEKGDNILSLDGTGPDGDEHFTEYDEEGNFMGYDYSIDLEDFDGVDVDVYKSIQHHNGKTHYGAGKDG